MKKLIFAMILTLFLINLINAEIEVKEKSLQSVVIAEINNPAEFEFTINNRGNPDNFNIYSLVGITFEPEEFRLEEGENTIPLTIQLDNSKTEKIGFFNFEYKIKGKQTETYVDAVLIKIVNLKDILEITTEPLLPNENAEIKIRNIEKIKIENMKVKLKSEFFRTEKEVVLEPFETIIIPIEIDNEQVKRLKAGAYIVEIDFEINDKKVHEESILNYLEKEGLSVETTKEGFIIKKNTIKKTNEGNTPVKATFEIKKDIISRLFTTTNPNPALVERNGLRVNYYWEQNLNPDESFSVTTRTNYTIPFIIILLIVAIIVLVKMYSQTAIVLTKRVSLIRTKQGEFALKVNIKIKAKKHADKIQINDKLPSMTKLYEKFGIRPDKIDKDSRRLTWNLEKLNKGEERVFSYIIYSNLKVVGRFELPSATAIYEKDGKLQEVWSNRTFFAAESSNPKSKS